MEQHDDLYRLRHSLAHVLAQAVLQLRPGAKLAFGPPIDTGCYYDFQFDQPITLDDFPEIEKNMRRIIGANQPFERQLRSADEAADYLRTRQEPFKVEYCQELHQRGEQQISFYKNGPFEDMCEGPHVESTGKIPPDCFKIDSVAGAYWRGNEKNPQLSRLYCLAFANRKDLEEYTKNRELARERDHRKLGKELELFIISDIIGPGLPLWMPNGTAIKEALEALAKETETRYGYHRVSTPHLAKEDLYIQSGHLPYYKDTMFPPMNIEGEANYYLKPMNCPHHHQIYNHRPRSYRELPLRMAEYAMVYRYEPSGTLAGLLRVRALEQNDAHIYCTVDQLKSEIIDTVNLHYEYYRRFRFNNVKARFSVHDPKNTEKYLKNPEMWSFSEKVVSEVLSEMNAEFVLGIGEAAFYGPKIDFQASTLLGREESIGTTQLDFGQPISFNLKYIGEDGKEHQVFVVHRAPLGTHERFIAFLIEHFGGAFPTWMAPVQVRFVPVNEDCVDYCQDLANTLRQALVRCEVDGSSNSFNKKIREAVTHKIPNIAIVGAKEKESQSITLRRYCVKEQVTMTRDRFIDRMKKLLTDRIMDNFPDVIVGE